jgi:hypothetical protein
MRRSALYPKGWRLDTQDQWQPEPGTDPASRPRDAQGGSPNDGCTEDAEIGYPQVYCFGGRHVVVYANKTCQLRISEVPAALLDDAGLPVA